MTPSTGTSSFACVDQFPSSDGDTYLSSNAANQSVAFVPGVLPDDVIDILAVIPLARGKGDGTASYSTTMALSGQEFVAPAFVPPSANYAANPQMVMELNPQGGSWDINTFPASNIVVTAQANGQLKITDVYTQVIYTKNPNFEWIEMVQYTQFPNDISYGSLSTIGFSTSVVQADSGTNQRTARWDQALRKYNISYGVRTREQLHDLIQFFHAMKGRYYSFLYFDWADYSSNFATQIEERGVPPVTDTDQIIGTGDGSTKVFQLTKTYQTKNGATSHVRLITKPMTTQWTDAQMTIPWSPVLISLNAWACKNFTVDQMTGLVTFGTPPIISGTFNGVLLDTNKVQYTGAPGTFPQALLGQTVQISGAATQNNCPMFTTAECISVAEDGGNCVIEYFGPGSAPIAGSWGMTIQGHDGTPVDGSTVFAGFYFYVPVQFDTDEISTNFEDYGVGAVDGVKLTEVRPTEALGI
jgi:uncharacterized protein (TIGR02217 family)